MNCIVLFGVTPIVLYNTRGIASLQDTKPRIRRRLIVWYANTKQQFSVHLHIMWYLSFKLCALFDALNTSFSRNHEIIKDCTNISPEVICHLKQLPIAG